MKFSELNGNFSFSGEQQFANWLRMLHIAHLLACGIPIASAKCRWLQWYIALQLHLVALAIRIKRTKKKYVKLRWQRQQHSNNKSYEMCFSPIMIMLDLFARTCAGWNSGQASERVNEQVLPISYISYMEMVKIKLRLFVTVAVHFCNSLASSSILHPASHAHTFSLTIRYLWSAHARLWQC